jgi:zinc protease
MVIARSLDRFVDVLEDVLARPGFAADELDRLRRETHSELIETLDNDRALVRRWFHRKAFEQHPVGRPVHGTTESTKRIGGDDVRSLYQRTVNAHNLAFAFAGDIERPQACQIADRLALGLSHEQLSHTRVTDPLGPQGRRLVVVDKPERTQTQILIGGMGTHPHDADHIALHVANTICGGTFSARMTQRIRTERGWSYGAYSSLPIDRHRSAFSMWTFPKASDAAACIRLQLEMLSQWREAGVTADELDWAKSYLVRSHAFSIDTAAKRAGLALDEVIYDLPVDYYRSYIERIEAVTLEAANQAVRARIPEENLLVTVVGTEAEIGAAVQDAIDGLDTVEVIPFDADS